MEKVEINKYQNGKIYKIVSNSSDDVYYGSTIETLSSRLGHHRANYKGWKNGKYHYVTSFKLIEMNDYEIVLVEKYACTDKSELFARERFYIENNHCVNKVIPGRTIQEYNADNKDRKRKYYEDNKDKIKEYRKDNEARIKEAKKVYREKNKAQLKIANKAYCDENKDRIKEARKAYHEKNKARLSLAKKVKYQCVCGSELRKSDKSQHERSIKHKQFTEKTA